MNQLKASITRTELYQMIWKDPMTKVAPQFGLSDVGLAKACKRYNIPRPPVGYWAQKQFGKQPPQTPLPAASENQQLIEFIAAEQAKPADKKTTKNERVQDEQLKALIEHEVQEENRILVPEQVSKYHPFVQQTKEAFADRNNDRGLYYPGFMAEGARLDIRIGKDSIPRALRLIDTIIKTVEDRGHKVVTESKEHRKETYFELFGEKFTLQLREKTKMTRISEDEQKKKRIFYSATYEPIGLLELRLHGKCSYSQLATWKDGSRKTLEDQLNDILIGFIIGVESERNCRKQREIFERQCREEERKRWQQEENRRKEQQKIQEMDEMMDWSDKATRIRKFVQVWRSHIESTEEVIEEGSELAVWIEWALNYADRIDPLGRKSRQLNTPSDADDVGSPRKPR